MPEDHPPKLTDQQVVEIVRRVVCRSDFYARPRCQEYFRALDNDLASVAELLADCTVDELIDQGLDDDYPNRQCYIAEFKIHVEGERIPFYIKVALLLPELESGYLLSFHL